MGSQPEACVGTAVQPPHRDATRQQYLTRHRLSRPERKPSGGSARGQPKALPTMPLTNNYAFATPAVLGKLAEPADLADLADQLYRIQVDDELQRAAGNGSSSLQSRLRVPHELHLEQGPHE